MAARELQGTASVTGLASAGGRPVLSAPGVCVVSAPQTVFCAGEVQVIIVTWGCLACPLKTQPQLATGADVAAHLCRLPLLAGRDAVYVLSAPTAGCGPAGSLPTPDMPFIRDLILRVSAAEEDSDKPHPRWSEPCATF